MTARAGNNKIITLLRLASLQFAASRRCAGCRNAGGAVTRPRQNYRARFRRSQEEIAMRELFAAGLVVRGYVAITLTMAAATAFADTKGGRRIIALRARGSWIAAIGLTVGCYTLASG
jgi:hypothetical protein